jgi:hypothetical protein
MAKPDWGALQDQFLAEHAKSGISKDWCEAQGLNYATAKRYIKVTNYGANSQKSSEKSANSQKGKTRPKRKCEKNPRDAGNTEISPQTKPIRGSRHAPIINHFSPAISTLKHGGRRMLLSDAITEDAQMLTLDDELFLRAANLTAAENIGRWQTELEVAGEEKAKELHALISLLRKPCTATRRASSPWSTPRAISSRCRLRRRIAKRLLKKVELEIGVMKDGDRDNAIVVHNALPIPGR